MVSLQTKCTDLSLRQRILLEALSRRKYSFVRKVKLNNLVCSDLCNFTIALYSYFCIYTDTTGLQSVTAVMELNGSITVTCTFATGASSIGCQVTIFIMQSLQKVFTRNIARQNGEICVSYNTEFKFRGLLKNLK